MGALQWSVEMHSNLLAMLLFENEQSGFNGGL